MHLKRTAHTSRIIPPAAARHGVVLALLLALASPAHQVAAAASVDAIKTMILEGRNEEAIAAARKRLAENPRDPEPHVLIANALLGKALQAAGRSGRISRADAEAIAKEMESGILLAPTRKDIYLGLVDVWSAAGDDEEVLKQIKRSAAQFPADVKMMSGLLDYGFARQTRNDPLAGPILEAIHAAYPQQLDAIMAWATHLLGDDNLDRATVVLEAGIAGQPFNSDLLEALGDAYAYRRDFDAAVKLYARGSAADPKRRTIRLKWATTLHLLDPKSAPVVAEPLQREDRAVGKAPTIAMGPDGSVAGSGRVSRGATALVRALSQPDFGALDAFGLARTYWQMGLGPEAIIETQIALTNDPLMVEAWMLRADLYTRMGMHTQALGAIQQADAIYELAGERTYAYSRDEVIAALAAALSRQDRNAEALETLKRATDSSRFAYRMAVLAERTGKIEEARALLEQVIAAAVDPDEVQAARSRLELEIYRKQP